MAAADHLGAAARRREVVQRPDRRDAHRGTGPRQGVERVVVVHGLGRLAGVDADRLARGQQVAGLQQRIDKFQHGRVLGGALEYVPAPDEGVDALRPLPLEVVAPLDAKVEVRLQLHAQGLDLGGAQHVPEDDETLLVVAGEVVVGRSHQPSIPITRKAVAKSFPGAPERIREQPSAAKR